MYRYFPFFLNVWKFTFPNPPKPELFDILQMWDVECGVEQNNREVDIDVLGLQIWAVWPCPSPSPRAGEEEATLTRSEAAAEAAGQAGTSCGAAESAPPPTAALAGGG